MPTGTVKTINLERGFGFVEQAAGKPDLFFHFSAVQDMDFDESLRRREVSFSVVNDPVNGKPRAVDVRPLR